MPDDGVPVLSLREVRKHFGDVPVLRGISLDVAPGTFLSVVGPNGAGKTTLFNCISRVMRPSSGTIRFRGEDVSGRDLEFRRALGYISHQLFLYPELTGRENLRFFARLYNRPDDPAALDASLAGMGLATAADRPVRTYSRGMKQRLAIARALQHQPELVLLDEPFTGLDQHAAVILRDLLHRLKGEGRTILMISHQLEHAAELGDRILVLVSGRIRAEVAAAETGPDRLAALYLDAVSRHGGAS
ncbi:MAG: heme ABC exporter ATP-binding protein CcmA [Acidobacteria bacterium]|nr:heme ABC exporter ATP-binding protein CcmA [Acidobacteriota bacterium]